MPKRLKG